MGLPHRCAARHVLFKQNWEEYPYANWGNPHQKRTKNS